VIKQHHCVRGQKFNERPCPCGCGVVLVCACCGRDMLAMLAPGRVPCSEMETLIFGPGKEEG
jgi:hypothetical protein